MDRRKSLKIFALTALSGGVLAEACKSEDKKKTLTAASQETAPLQFDRMQEEKELHEKLVADRFFDEHEMATIAVLSDIIIPKDEVSGSATEAGVPAFIEYIVKDQPGHQVPLRGGLRWLDMQSHKRYGKPFIDGSAEQRLAIVNDIAYPEKAKPEMKQGVSFFNRMRDLVATGFYTTQMGFADLGYAGNKPNQWNGVPDDVLKQYGLRYTEKELNECVKFDKA